MHKVFPLFDLFYVFFELRLATQHKLLPVIRLQAAVISVHTNIIKRGVSLVSVKRFGDWYQSLLEENTARKGDNYRAQ